MHMKEAASSVESIRKALQDFLAPELRGELHAVEARMKEAIDQAKCEILLTVQLADSEQRNAVLQRKANELEQKPPQ